MRSVVGFFHGRSRRRSQRLHVNNIIEKLFLRDTNKQNAVKEELCNDLPIRLDPSRELEDIMLEERLPYTLDIERIYYFLERLKEQRQKNPDFWKSPLQNVEFIYFGDAEDNTILSTVDIIDEIERLASWLRSVPLK